MITISEWLWEGLYTLKKLYDHGKADSLLAELADQKLDGDYVGEIAMCAMYEVFAETRDYWDERTEEETYVFFDPIFDNFYRLCREYEAKHGIKPGKNTHRTEIERAIRVGLCFNDYSYCYHVFDGSQRDGSCKLVLKIYPDFCSLYEIAGGLIEVYDAFANHVERLKQELSVETEAKIIELPRALRAEEQEAA